MANDYIPPPDARFDAWQNNFVTCINGYPADVGLVASDVVALNNSAATWTTNYPPHAAVRSCWTERNLWKIMGLAPN